MNHGQVARFVALALLLAGCNSNSGSSTASQDQPTSVTGRPLLSPPRRLIARIREDVSGDKKKSDGTDFIMLDRTTASTAKIGDTLRVELKAATGTGYQWMFAGCDSNPTDDALKQATEPTVIKPLFDWQKGEGKVQPTEPGKPGAPAYTVFEFSAAQAGTSTMHFVLVRPWEKGAKPTDTRTLQMTVRGN
jgi:predicted secreted protein